MTRQELEVLNSEFNFSISQRVHLQENDLLEMSIEDARTAVKYLKDADIIVRLNLWEKNPILAELIEQTRYKDKHTKLMVQGVVHV